MDHFHQMLTLYSKAMEVEVVEMDLNGTRIVDEVVANANASMGNLHVQLGVVAVGSIQCQIQLLVTD